MARPSIPTNPSPGRPVGSASSDRDGHDAGRPDRAEAAARVRAARRGDAGHEVEDPDAAATERAGSGILADTEIDISLGDPDGGTDTDADADGRTASRPSPSPRPRPRPRPGPRPRVEEPSEATADLDADADADDEPDLDEDADLDEDGDGEVARPAARAASRIAPRRIPTSYLWWVVAVLGALAVSLAVVTYTVFGDWRHARARADARAAVPSLAKTYAARILAYDYHHLQKDTESTVAVLTGDYAEQYRHSMDKLIIPLATQTKATVRVEVLGAGTVRVDPDGDEATVLVFANQTVTNTRVKGGRRVDQVRIRLTLVRKGHTWKVSKLDLL